jgi:hypothetical protein
MYSAKELKRLGKRLKKWKQRARKEHPSATTEAACKKLTLTALLCKDAEAVDALLHMPIGWRLHENQHVISATPLEECGNMTLYDLCVERPDGSTYHTEYGIRWEYFIVHAACYG